MASSRKRRWDNKTEVREEALFRLALQENAFDNDMMNAAFPSATVELASPLYAYTQNMLLF